MLGAVEEIDYDGDRVRKVILRFPALRAGDSAMVKEVRACERIGQGSFGTVYRAVCEDYPRLALKISTGKSTRLRQELDVLSRVCTKGRLLLPRFEFGALNKTADLIVIGMELCVPSTLHDLLLSTRITSEAEMLFMAYQVVQAVSYVHEEGCIHRDIKLQNFVFDLDGNLKLIDFGLACNSLSPPAGDVVAGTVSFMSPEMAHNALHKEKRVSVGVAADVWSLGIVLFSIFTQRNPYPSVEVPTRRGSSASTEGAPWDPEHGSEKQDKENNSYSKNNDFVAQQRMNERLLRRVAAGDWQWPVGVSVSDDLKQLVNSILILNPEKRPTVKQILQNKLWNLRRRYPPAAIAAFLGVQDDFLLSHDEAHLMRAVEERSAGVTASLLHSRVESSNTSSSASHGSKDVTSNEVHDSRHLPEQRRKVGSHSNISSNGAVEEEQQLVFGTTTTPIRGSLKVVQRGGEGGVDGAVAVQVYDVRASTRKRSKPIREISVVMAEEAAKRRQSKSRGRTKKSTAMPGSASAPTSRRPSRASSLHGSSKEEKAAKEEEPEPRRASSAGASLQLAPSASRTTRAMLLDDWGEDEEKENGGMEKAMEGEEERERDGRGRNEVVVIPRPVERTISTSVSKSRSPPRQGSIHCSANRSVGVLTGEEKEKEKSIENSEQTGTKLEDSVFANVSAATFTPHNAAFTKPLFSETLSSIESKPSSAVQSTECQRSGSVELVGNSDTRETPSLNVAQWRQGESSTSVGQRSTDRRTMSGKLPRNTSLRQTSSLILHGVTRPQSKSRPTTPTPTATEPETVVVGSASQDSMYVDSAKSKSVIKVPIAVAAAPPTRAQRIALELSLDVMWQDEAADRRYLSSALLIEHEWLLASFRLTIEEDQERYNITWLAEEQEKSAAHPHRFKEMTRVTSKKYQYGFVCDLCDYEFLPEGPEERDLHYFHCPCGRDLCPDCYEEYRRQCTCSCCRVVHPNSCVLREHLLQTGGVQYYGELKGMTRDTAASLVGVRGSHKNYSAGAQYEEDALPLPAQAPPAPRRRGRPRRSETLSNANDYSTTPTPQPNQTRISAAKDTGRRRRRGVDTAAAAAAMALNVDVDADTAENNNEDEVARVHLPRMSVAAMQQESLERTGGAQRGRGRGGSTNGGGGGRGGGQARANGTAAPPLQPEEVEVKQRPVEHPPEGPWRPFARFKKDRKEEAARQPTPEERNALLNGEWIRYFYLFPNTGSVASPGSGICAGAHDEAEEPFAFVYHAQPGRTGAIFLTSDFPMHSAVFSMLERQFFVVDQVDTVNGADATRATSLLRAKGQPGLNIAFQALQDIVAYDTNMMKQQRTPGTVSVYQAPRSAYSCNGEPFLYVRWFRFNEDRTLSAFLLSNGAVQVFVNNEYELRWFDESRKFLIRYNGVCELVEDNTFALAPAINHLLYDSFDE